MSAPHALSGHVFGILKGNRRFFSPDDDRILCQFKSASPELSWDQLSKCMPGFSARQLRERWGNYLCPTLNTASWTPGDDQRLLDLYSEYGPKWGVIGSFMNNRAAPDIKNRFQLVRNRRDRDHRMRSRRKDTAKLETEQPIDKIPLEKTQIPGGGDRPPAGVPGLADFSIKSLLW